MDLRPAIVPTIHTLLAAGLGILAVIGLFGTASAGEGTVLVGGWRFAFIVILPMIGIVMFGLYDWQMGRGSGILRAADVAVFALAASSCRSGRRASTAGSPAAWRSSPRPASRRRS